MEILFPNYEVYRAPLRWALSCFIVAAALLQSIYSKQKKSTSAAEQWRGLLIARTDSDIEQPSTVMYSSSGVIGRTGVRASYDDCAADGNVMFTLTQEIWVGSTS